MKIYRVFYEYEDEHNGYTNDLNYYKNRCDAELFLIDKACKEFPDNINDSWNVGYIYTIQDTRHQGNNFYHIEEIYIIE